MEDWGGYVAVLLVLAAAFYVYLSLSLMTIARKAGRQDGWMAWIPVLNMLLMCRVAGKPGWWILLMLIPVVNLVVAAIIWMGVARTRGKPQWTGILIFVPLVNILIPGYLASGPATGTGPQPGVAGFPPPPAAPSKGSPAGTGVCAACGTVASPGEVFCGECGAPLPAVPPQPARPAPEPAPPVMQPPAVPSRSRARVVLIAAGVVVIGGALAGYFLFVAYTAPARQAPAMPQRMAGMLKEFPVDTDTSAPARPTAIVSQPLRSGAPNLPVKRLPPGVTPSLLRNTGESIISAAYRSKAQEPAVEVHVIDSAAPRDASREIERAALTGAGPDAKETGVRLESANGSRYEGWKILSPRILVYVLQDSDSVVIIYAPDLAVREVADRLASDVGNGSGLNDYPGVQDSLWNLPAQPPPGLELTEWYSYGAGDLVSPQELKRSLGVGAEADEWITKAKDYVPEHITTATYRDTSRSTFRVAIGNFGSSLKALMVWNLVRWWIPDTPGSPFLVRSGPFLGLIMGPDSASREQLKTLARALQF